jgi:hypothetical protein
MINRDCEDIGENGSPCRFKSFVYAGNRKTGAKAYLYCNAFPASILLDLEYIEPCGCGIPPWHPRTPASCSRKVFHIV